MDNVYFNNRKLDEREIWLVFGFFLRSPDILRSAGFEWTV
jgi:hypothetical protein